MTDPTSIVRADDALLAIVDIQERLAAVMPRRAAVTTAAEKLARTAGLLGIPMVVTRQYPKGLGDTEADLRETLERLVGEGASVTHVDKVAFDCFADEAFAEAVRASGRRQLVLAGMESHICIAQTALAGLELGLDVHVVADACCSRESASHDIALARLARAGAVVTTWESVAYEAVGVAGTPAFKAMLEIVKA